MKLYALYEKIKIGEFTPQSRQYVKDFVFIKDQLINAWEYSDEKEMAKHLISQTKFDKNKLTKFIYAWYNDDRRRNKIIMSLKPGDPDFEKWFNEYINV